MTPGAFDSVASPTVAHLIPPGAPRRYRRGMRTRQLVPKALALAVSLLLLAGCGGPALLGGLPGSTAGQISTLLSLVNQARSQPRSCGGTTFAAAPPLALNARLTLAAQGHSEDMQASGTFSHTGSDGSTLADRVDRQGYSWSALAEDIAYGFDTPQAAVDAWLASPGHCSAIMEPQYRDLGAGVAGVYWTLDFGAPR